VTEPAILALEDGTVFHGVSIGASGQTIGEVVFNTSMSGYQEILTDPSYCRQMVTLTYPHIGNTGINSDDNESQQIYAAGLIIRDLPVVMSSWRAEIDLAEFLQRGNVVAIAEIDTRKLTRILRDKGAQSGCIMTGNADEATAVAHAKRFPGLAGMDLAKIVTTPVSGRTGRPQTFWPASVFLLLTSSLTISVSSAIFCAYWSGIIAGLRWCRRRHLHQKYWRYRPMVYFYRTVRVIPSHVIMQLMQSA